MIPYLGNNMSIYPNSAIRVFCEDQRKREIPDWKDVIEGLDEEIEWDKVTEPSNLLRFVHLVNKFNLQCQPLFLILSITSRFTGMKSQLFDKPIQEILVGC